MKLGLSILFYMLVSIVNASTGPNTILYLDHFTKEHKAKLLSTADDKTLLLVDVDGTSLQGKLLINPIFRDFINDAQERGALFLPFSAMASMCEDQREHFAQLNPDERGPYADSVRDSPQNPIVQRSVDLLRAGFKFKNVIKEGSATWPNFGIEIGSKLQLKPHLPMLFGGFMSTDLVNDKGIMLQALFAAGFQKLKNIQKIIAFDDQAPYLQGEAVACKELGIHFTGILLRDKSIFPSPDTPWGPCPACTKQ